MPCACTLFYSVLRGTSGSNPASSSGESGMNLFPGGNSVVKALWRMSSKCATKVHTHRASVGAIFC